MTKRQSAGRFRSRCLATGHRRNETDGPEYEDKRRNDLTIGNRNATYENGIRGATKVQSTSTDAVRQTIQLHQFPDDTEIVKTTMDEKVSNKVCLS